MDAAAFQALYELASIARQVSKDLQPTIPSDTLDLSAKAFIAGGREMYNYLQIRAKMFSYRSSSLGRVDKSYSSWFPILSDTLAVLDFHIGYIIDQKDLFLKAFAENDWRGANIVSVSFTASSVEFVYVTDEGEHLASSTSIQNYQQWFFGLGD